MDVLIVGSKGRMGSLVDQILANDQLVKNVYKFDQYETNDNHHFNHFDLVPKVDVIVDFSNPILLDSILNFAVKHKTPLLIATTGYRVEEIKKIHDASKMIPIFMSANYSVGIELISKVLRDISKYLENDYDIEIVERHHNHKVDAPSGTSLHLANQINESLESKKNIINGHHQKRSSTDLAIHAIRGGSVVGEHDVIFFGLDEVIEIKHIAQSRNIFAYGAIKAMKFLLKQEVGFYQMKDLFKE
jgi:4-hydroxy-tetrahydrodipicolinate reductase